jgi:hypothetical protein
LQALVTQMEAQVEMADLDHRLVVAVVAVVGMIALAVVVVEAVAVIHRFRE